MAYPDAWDPGNKVLISMAIDTTGTGALTFIDLEPIVTSIKWNPGSKKIEQAPTVAGGRIELRKPQEMYSLEFDAYWTGIDTADDAAGLGPTQFFNTSASFDTSQSLKVAATRGQNKYVVCIMFTNDTTVAGADEAITGTGSEAYRITVRQARMTEVTFDYDEASKGTFKFEGTCFTKAGVANYIEESTTGATLAAITSSTSFA
jgi:hypothetical protein